MHRDDHGMDGLNTISLVTHILGCSIVTLVVALRFGVKLSLRMPWVGEDGNSHYHLSIRDKTN